MKRLRVLTVYLSSYYSTGKGPSNEMGIFHGVFASLGCDEIHFPLEQASNLTALGRLRENGPYDIVFVVPYEGVYDWLRDVAPGAPIVCWHSDGTWRFRYQQEWLMADAVDLTVTTDADNAEALRAIGAAVHLSNWGARPDLWAVRPPILQPQVAASFCGFLYEPRQSRLAAIAAAGPIDVMVHDCRAELFSVADYHKFAASYVYALCLSGTSAEPGKAQFKSRMFECQVNGVVLVTEPCPRLEEFWVPDEECIVWRTPEECQSKMATLLDGGPEAYLDMTRRAFERTLREHTMQHRLAEILALLRLPYVPPDFSAVLTAPEDSHG